MLGGAAPPVEKETSRTPERRLIIIIVQSGEDPEIETEPPNSFATYEMVSALNRAVEILEEEEILSVLDQEEGEEDG